MYISKIHLKNYKSFLDSQEINLTSGFNIILGQNNVGKTAFIESMSSLFSNIPHRSEKTVPHRSFQIQEDSLVDINITMNFQEFRTILESITSRTIVTSHEVSFEVLARIFSSLIEGDINLYFTRNGKEVITSGLREFERGEGAHYSFNIVGNEIQATSVLHGGKAKDFTIDIAEYIMNRIYIFRAERRNAGRVSIGHNESLASDAANLPAVLHKLQSSNPSRYNKLIKYLNIVFPDIKYITTPASGSNTEINVWSIDIETERDDLSTAITSSGTGISQVLSILYVILTSDYPRIIIIDEPQSFLHPGAIRKLLDILKQHPQHQYILTTHSPTVVTSVGSQKLYIVQKNGLESSVKTINANQTEELQMYLSEIGARLSDVFGADNILWVEGRTEEECFPKIVERLCKRHLFGTEILGVLHTGDLEGKDANRVFTMYDRLSRGRNLLPPALGFIFDKENRSQTKIDDIFRQSKGNVHFIERMMYENYLLNPKAIASVMCSIENFRELPVTADEVSIWIASNYSESVSNYDRWIKTVDGAKILKQIFNQLSESRVSYDKVLYGSDLTDWIIEHSPSDLQELVDLLNRALGTSPMR